MVYGNCWICLAVSSTESESMTALEGSALFPDALETYSIRNIHNNALSEIYFPVI